MFSFLLISAFTIHFSSILFDSLLYDLLLPLPFNAILFPSRLSHALQYIQFCQFATFLFSRLRYGTADIFCLFDTLLFSPFRFGAVLYGHCDTVLASSFRFASIRFLLFNALPSLSLPSTSIIRNCEHSK